MKNRTPGKGAEKEGRKNQEERQEKNTNRKR